MWAVGEQEAGDQFVHIISEMLIRHPNRDVKWTVGYWSPEFKEEVVLGEIKFGSQQCIENL